ncbi:MAG TPA: helix-turn-helix domain-containing protein [Actinophytocola sp.]|uniref:PucR family transcriptional regulator n=1 Tax=Actinophytocola sp. TaxID=1872138 RepID=UPI002DBF5D6F|nr:helix-turn-helix domain-containing protein [Actinophytocola sp.]HEU5471038.1 helix-turn-helix domain-containing protein [Actinophytocola sp.]
MLDDSPAAEDLADHLDMHLAKRYLVLVVRVPGLASGRRHDRVVQALLRRRRIPVAWYQPDELVMLLPSSGSDPTYLPAAPQPGALGLVREVAGMLEAPCAAGIATGRTGALAGVVALARSISRVAPAQATPNRLHTMADVFIELGVMRLPEVDHWLGDLARRLTAGPDLVGTLDAYYQNDMSRLNTAEALRIHPRTLDYRLHRVRQLVDIDPGSASGVRILSTAVTRALAVTRRHGS